MRPRRRAGTALAAVFVAAGLLWAAGAGTLQTRVPVTAAATAGGAGDGSSQAATRARGPAGSARQAARDARAAYRVMELPSGRVLAEERPDVLSTMVAPGSIVKIATLAAALEAGLLDSTSRFPCTRTVVVSGRSITCAHPDLHRPLTAVEALAHSCNTVFASLAARLPRQRFNASLIHLGLTPAASNAALVPAALGLEGIRATPERLLAVIVRVSGSPRRLPYSEATIETLVEGLKGAATYGTAAAFREAGLDAIAKTGTAPMPGGGYMGMVVAAAPATYPTQAVVVVQPGGAGSDAARLAAALMAEHGAGTSAAIAQRPATPTSTASAQRPATPAVDVSVRLGRLGSGGYAVSKLTLEDYVAGVVAGEAAPRSEAAALEALAITARTYALANPGRHGSEGFDLCDLTHCQVVREATEASRRAAAATRGQVIAWQGRLATVFYTASCGGRSAAPSEVWAGHATVPYLRSAADPACAAAPVWTSHIPARDLVRALRAAGLRGDALRELRVVERSASGRVARLSATGFTPVSIGGNEFRLAVGRTLGWQLVKSTAFVIERTAEGYRFEGRGSGHGVGLCVTGSATMARDGRTARDILQRYFPGTEVRDWRSLQDAALVAAASGGGALPEAHGSASGALASSSPAVPGSASATRCRVTLAAAEQGDRPQVEGLCARLLGALEAATGRAAPARTELVFHPTADSYRRATGQPWWTAASTSGARVDLQPLSVLRRRGVLDATLHHELAHVLTAPALEGRPEWVKEGAAMHFARQDYGGVEANAPCPTDAEVRRPENAEAMRDALARAAACFARQIRSGVGWTDVR